MRLMTNTWVVVYANCLVSWKRAWNVDSDDLNLSPCFSSLCLCVWVTWGSHFFSPFVQWDPGSHSSQGWWNNVNHDWRARALPCLQTFPKPSPLPTHHILHGEASSSVAQGGSRSSLHFSRTSMSSSCWDFTHSINQMLLFAVEPHLAHMITCTVWRNGMAMYWEPQPSLHQSLGKGLFTEHGKTRRNKKQWKKKTQKERLFIS